MKMSFIPPLTGGAVQEAVQSGGGHNGIASEDMALVAEGFVGGDDGGGLFFVTTADNLAQQRSMIVIAAEVTDFVNDEQFGRASIFKECGMRSAA